MRIATPALLASLLLATAIAGLMTTFLVPEPSLCDSYIGEGTCSVTSDGVLELQGPAITTSGYYVQEPISDRPYSELFGAARPGFTLFDRGALFLASIGVALVGCGLLAAGFHRYRSVPEGAL